MTLRLATKNLAIIACGDRNWTNDDLIRETLLDYDPDMVIEGEARGADKLSRMVAEQDLGLSVADETILPYPAEWKKYARPGGKGNPAGPIRNGQMLERLLEFQDAGWEIAVVAFHEDIENSKGTKDMVDKAKKAGVNVEIVSS